MAIAVPFSALQELVAVSVYIHFSTDICRSALFPTSKPPADIDRQTCEYIFPLVLEHFPQETKNQPAPIFVLGCTSNAKPTTMLRKCLENFVLYLAVATLSLYCVACTAIPQSSSPSPGLVEDGVMALGGRSNGKTVEIPFQTSVSYLYLQSKVVC